MDEAISIVLEKLDAAMTAEDYLAVTNFASEILKLPVDEAGTENIVRTSVILGFAFIKQNRPEEAKKVLQTLLDNEIAVVDALFLLFSIAYDERSTDDIVHYGSLFVDVIPNPKNPPKNVTSAAESAHELLNNYATTLLSLSRHEEAILALRKGIEFRSDYPLLYINMSIAYHHLDDFNEAETILAEGLKSCSDKSEIERTLGLIYLGNHYYLNSEIYFRKAVESGCNEALLDLGILFQKLLKIEDSEEALLEYLQFFPDNSDALELLNGLKSLPFYDKPEPRISAALIVKNEENMLAECIESFREAVDEIVIVDTGSSDKTVEIAKEFQVNLYHHEWKDDFSEARNFSISKTTGDWVLIIDADERIAREDIPNIRAFKWQEKYDAVCFTVYSSLPGHLGDANFGKHYSPRLFKKSPDIYYYGIVHNLLNIPNNVAVSDIKLYHLGYDLDKEKMRKKYERSIKLLLKQVEERPDDPFVLMNTAQMFLSRNYIDEAEPYTKKIIELLEDNPGYQEHLLLMGIYQLSLIYLRREDYDECEKVCLKALEKKDNYIDPMLNLGMCYFQTGEYDKSVAILEKFLKCRKELITKEEFNLLILNKLGSDYEADFIIGEIYRIKKDFKKAKEHLNKGAKSNNVFWNIHNSLGKIYLEEKEYSEAVAAFENAIKYGYLNAEKYGTMGSSQDEYKQAIENYKFAIEKNIVKQKTRPTVKDALGKIDALLEGD